MTTSTDTPQWARDLCDNVTQIKTDIKYLRERSDEHDGFTEVLARCIGIMFILVVPAYFLVSKVDYHNAGGIVSSISVALLLTGVSLIFAKRPVKFILDKINKKKE